MESYKCCTSSFEMYGVSGRRGPGLSGARHFPFGLQAGDSWVPG